MTEPLPLPISPVEPDVSATPVAVQIDPMAVLPEGVEEEVVMWAIPANTLVFRGHRPTLPNARAGHRGKLSQPQPVAACAYYVANEDEPLIPFGVAIDGNASAAESRRWPDERGRLAVAVTGTVTIAVHPNDIDKISVGDRLAVDHTPAASPDDKERGPHTCGFVGYDGFHIPRIVKFDPTRIHDIEIEMEAADRSDTATYRALLQKHRALDSFGVALEVGFCEMRVLLTP